MSGILGIFFLDGKPATDEILLPAVQASVTFGGDNSGTWIKNSVALAHQMLHVTHESIIERLPFTQNGHTITAAARIDNRSELIRQFSVPQKDHISIPDSIIILKAYEKWGESCTAHLIGEYAFAIWDDTSRTLFCARDHIGTQPFYYYHYGTVFAFASDLLGLLAFPDVPDEIDELEIAQLLFMPSGFHYNDKHTFFQHIFKLPCACQISVSAEGTRIIRHWYPEEQPQLQLPSLDQYAGQLLDVLSKAVSDRLRTPFGVGSQISGGLDSSSISVVASRLLNTKNNKIIPYSWSPKENNNISPGSELCRIEAICQQEGLQCQYLSPTPQEMVWADMLDPATRPIDTQIVERIHLQNLSAKGVRLILTGWGGDHSLTYQGNGHIIELFESGRWQSLINNLRGQEELSATWRIKSLLGYLRGLVLLPYLSDKVYDTYVQFRSKKPQERFIQHDFSAQTQSHLRPFSFIRTLRGKKRDQLAHYFNGHLTQRLECWAWSAAQLRMSYSYPMLDRRVMEFALSLPGEMSWQKGWRRFLFRYAMQDTLPKGFAWEKMGNVKLDPAFWAYKDKINPERLPLRNTRYLELLSQNQDIPWINITRLQAALEKPNMDIPIPDFAAIHRACQVVLIWHHWKERQK